MLENISNTAVAILSMTIGGVSIGGLIAFAIAFIKYIVKERKRRLAEKTQNELTVETIKQCFQDVLLPKNIKLDVSNKIQQPLKEGLEDIKLAVMEKITLTEEELKLILQILAQFNHVKKLPEETQAQIAYVIDKGTTEEVQL